MIDPVALHFFPCAHLLEVMDDDESDVKLVSDLLKLRKSFIVLSVDIKLALG